MSLPGHVFRMWRMRRRRREALKIPLEQRIAHHADELRKRGYEAIAALAAAEAVETGREHGLNYDHVEYDEEQLRWWGYYETGPRRHPVILVLPLPHATEATQRGIASLN
jgi:hypothetical protein